MIYHLLLFPYYQPPIFLHNLLPIPLDWMDNNDANELLSQYDRSVLPLKPPLNINISSTYRRYIVHLIDFTYWS